MARIKEVLFICTHNSARSQLAEGLVNALYSDKLKAYSAGTEKTRVNPLAVEVLREIGIDISNHTSKTVDVFKSKTFDVVVTVCDHARETCPFFPGKRVIHRGFTDPSDVEGEKYERLAAFRRVRDEINQWIREYLLKEIEC